MFVVTPDAKQTFHQSSSQPPDELSLSPNKANTMTFARIVSEGSRISMSCPRSTMGTSSYETSDASKLRNSNIHELLQESSNKFAKQTDPQVKWFKKQVEITNSTRQQDTNNARRVLSELNGIRSAPTSADATSRVNAIELSQSGPINQPFRPELQTMQEQFEAKKATNILNTPEKSNSFELGQNVDESREEFEQTTSAWQPTNSIPPQTSPEWYINAFGELIISNVSQYWAGTYTCIVDGTERELVLHVLVASDSSNYHHKIQDTNFKESLDRHSKSSLVFFDSDKASSFDSNYQTNDATQEAGRGSIEERKYTDELQERPKLLGQTNNLQGLRDAHRLFDESGSSNNFPSNELDSITTTVGNVFGEENEQQYNLKFAKSGQNLRLKVKPFAKPAIRTRNISRSRRSFRRRPVHLIKSETILMEDLKLISGFLYTKQQLHCPVAGLNNILISRLADALCYSSNNAKEALVEEQSLLDNCRQLAHLIISSLLDIGNNTISNVNRCSSLTDITWFRENRRLKFDRNGRGTDTKLNVKLIDIQEQISAQDGARDKKNTNNQDIIGPSSSIRSSSCLPPTRKLEIDGIRKSNTGHYTCAYKLNKSTILSKLRAASQLTRSPFVNKWNNFISDNDISYCDEDDTSCKMLASSTNSQTSSILASETKTTLTSVTSGHPLSTTMPINLIEMEPTSDVVSLHQRLETLKSILTGTIGLNQSLNYIEQALTSMGNPLATVQKFSLVVIDRPGKLHHCAFSLLPPQILFLWHSTRIWSFASHLLGMMSTLQPLKTSN